MNKKDRRMICRMAASLAGRVLPDGMDGTAAAVSMAMDIVMEVDHRLDEILECAACGNSLRLLDRCTICSQRDKGSSSSPQTGTMPSHAVGLDGLSKSAIVSGLRSQEVLQDVERPAPTSTECLIPPEGWSCSRGYEHSGSCAARRVGPDRDHKHHKEYEVPWMAPISVYDSSGPDKVVLLVYLECSFRVSPIDEVGVDTGRERYKVECITCDELLSKGTTGPLNRINGHISAAHFFPGDIVYSKGTVGDE